MGGRSSRQVLSIETARARLSPQEQRCAEQFFYHHTTVWQGERELGFRPFRDYLLDALLPCLPAHLAEALFAALDLEKRGGLSLDELICGLAVLQHGTPEERFRLVFHAFDGDRDAQVTHDDVQRFAYYAGVQGVRFTRPEGKDAESFAEWARQHRDTELVSWIFEHEGKVFAAPDKRLEQQSEWHATLLPAASGAEPGAERRKMAAELGLSAREQEELCDAHAGLQQRSALGVVDAALLDRTLVSLPTELRAALAQAWDTTSSGTVSEREFLSAAAVCTHGGRREKLRFCFRLFDAEGAGTLRRADLYLMLAALRSDALLHQCAGGEAPRPRGDAASEELDGLVTDAFAAGPLSDDNRLGLDAFLDWAAPRRHLPVDFIDAVWTLVRVDLRLRPATSEEERAAVLRLRGTPFGPDNPGPPGAEWYLLHSEWWESWEAYIAAACEPYGKDPSPSRGVHSVSPPARLSSSSDPRGDPAKEDLDPSAAVRPPSSGRRRAGGAPRGSMPEINNAPLLDPVGRLRTDVQPGTDFVVLPALCWRALCAWYGVTSGIKPIVRRVPRARDDAHPPELELFPPRVKAGVGAPDQVRQFRTLQLSCATTLQELVDACCDAFSVPRGEPMRLWSAEPGDPRSPAGSAAGAAAGGAGATADALQACGYRLLSLDDECVTLGSLEVADGHCFIAQPTPAPDVTPQSARDSAGSCATVSWETMSGSAGSGLGRRQQSGNFPRLVSEPMESPLPAGAESPTELRADQRVESYYPVQERRGGGMGCTSSGRRDAATRSTHTLRGVVRRTTDEHVMVQFEQHRDGPVSVPREWVTRVIGESTFGRVGLQNLGNTCYMNSAVQCLSHTRMLREYFLGQGQPYAFDLNTDSPKSLGMGGKLAVAFAELLEELWMQDKRVHVPRNFRSHMGRFKPVFEGFRQQDSQEFLTAFLTGLSDDVNRVRGEKPYIELRDADFRTDAETADERWSAFFRRENSVVSSLFSGQLKGNARCETCGRNARQFDPVPLLALNLPEYAHRYVSVRVHMETLVTLTVTVAVPKSGTVQDLAAAVAAALGPEVGDGGGGVPDPGDVIPCELSQSGMTILRPRRLDAPLSVVSDWEAGRGVECHLLRGAAAALGTEADDDARVVQVLSRRMQQKMEHFRQPWRPVVFGAPFLLLAQDPALDTCEGLYTAVWARCRRLVPDWFPASRGGAAPRPFPFLLTRCRVDGSACSRCSWVLGCPGCVIPLSGSLDPPLAHWETVAVDWDSDALKTDYKRAIAEQQQEHRSVRDCLDRKAKEQECSLDNCFRSFCQEEHLKAYCPVCTKKEGEYTETRQLRSVKLWRFPPVLIIQLKRFRHDRGVSDKLGNLVTFPLQGLDLSSYRAAEEHAEEARRGDLLLGKEGIYEAKDREGRWWDITVKEKREKDGTYTVHVHDGTKWEDGVTGQTWPRAHKGNIRRKQWLGNLDRPPPATRDDTLYDLYAIVNHEGSTGGGHYYAYIHNSGQWWNFNDAVVVPIKESEVVTRAAYLLFYRRRATGPLQDVWSPPGPARKPVDIQQVKQAKWSRPRESRSPQDTRAGLFPVADACAVM